MEHTRELWYCHFDAARLGKTPDLARDVVMRMIADHSQVLVHDSDVAVGEANVVVLVRCENEARELVESLAPVVDASPEWKMLFGYNVFAHLAVETLQWIENRGLVWVQLQPGKMFRKITPSACVS